MGRYFRKNESIGYMLGDNIKETLTTVANAYMGRNPAIPFLFRVYQSGFSQNSDGRYQMDFNEKHPDASLHKYACGFSMLYSEEERGTTFSLNCFGPVTVFFGGKLLYQSDIFAENDPSKQKEIYVTLQKGYNTILIVCRKAPSGFGCIFGSNHSKWNPLDFLAPFAEREGQTGWIYSSLFDEKRFTEGSIPSGTQSESETGLIWFPARMKESLENPCNVLFGKQTGRYAYIRTAINNDAYESLTGNLVGTYQGAMRIWMDGKIVFAGETDGEIRGEITVPPGEHDILLESRSKEKGWAYDFAILFHKQKAEFTAPCNIKGMTTPYLYLGPFLSPLMIGSDALSLYQLQHNGEETLYWRAFGEHAWIRPYLENTTYAKWNYPIGVTLYGLLQTGRVLDRQDIIDYAVSHICECTRIYDYAKWDAKQYGYPSVNQQLIELNMLDDCGSFGSAMLEAYGISGDQHTLPIADTIADHMKNKQERKTDGAFYRLRKGSFNENTMWVDDLYMSVPFLIRYYELTGNEEYLDDAARQFLLFKQYLFIREHNVMSHVYDFKCNTSTYIPWGRGNGWAFFSLSEILQKMPHNHKLREALTGFYNELATGYLALQGENGLWHQLLTHPDSYEETSCTAMFAYGLARGLRLGFLKEELKNKAVKAVKKAWKGLTQQSIDRYGNVHGICRGSLYSFSPDYYKNELLWVTNDVHGIGIILLAGIEVILLMDTLKKE